MPDRDPLAPTDDFPLFNLWDVGRVPSRNPHPLQAFALGWLGRDGPMTAVHLASRLSGGVGFDGPRGDDGREAYLTVAHDVFAVLTGHELIRRIEGTNYYTPTGGLRVVGGWADGPDVA